MLNISSFLSKFSNKIKDDNDLRFLICDNVFKYTGIEIKPDDCVIKGNILFLDISPSFKNKVFIYKKDILSSMSSNSNIIDIR